MYDLYQGEIVSEITSDNCVLFIGSGLSMGSRVASWSEIIQRLVERLQCPMNSDFLTVAQAYEQIFGRPSLDRVICDATDTSRKTPTKVHRLLPKLRIKTWITTNYDDLLETTLREADCRFHPVIREQDVTTSSQDRILLVKLHGDRQDTDTCIFTKNDYFTARWAKKLIWDVLKIELLQKTFLFLGYSLSDHDFGQLQAQILYLLDRRRFRRSYAVMFGCDDVTRADLKSRNVTVIDLGNRQGTNATDALFHFLSEIVAKLSHLPEIERRHYDGSKAVTVLSRQTHTREKLETLRQMHCRLVCCIEYHVYCAGYDEGGFFTVPPDWRAPKPSDFSGPEYVALPYRRHDDDMTNFWVGWVIGKKA